MTRSDHSSSTYDDDFYTWTQEQAAAIRRAGARGTLAGDIDVEHLAEEVEDLGKRDLREVKSFLRLLVTHLLKIDANPRSMSVSHWRAEARTFSRSAADALTPGMRRLIDVGEIWRTSATRLAQDAGDLGLNAPPERPNCPFQLDDLLPEKFDVDVALADVARSERSR